MTEEREDQDEQQEDVQIPDDSVEDLEPAEEESGDVSGGFKRGWPS
jgi:hypothetical protein